MKKYTPTTSAVRSVYVVAEVQGQKPGEDAGAAFDRWLQQEETEVQSIALAWERERFDRLWQLEMDVCKCEEAMQHLKVRMERTQSGIDYKAEFGDNE